MNGKKFLKPQISYFILWNHKTYLNQHVNLKIYFLCYRHSHHTLKIYCLINILVANAFEIHNVSINLMINFWYWFWAHLGLPLNFKIAASKSKKNFNAKLIFIVDFFWQSKILLEFQTISAIQLEFNRMFIGSFQ